MVFAVDAPKARMKPKPLHVTGVAPLEMKMFGLNLFPFVSWMFRVMPDSMRKNTIAKKVNIYI